MRFSDKLLKCQKCGKRFVFTVTLQREMFESGKEMEEPRFCPRCSELVSFTARDGVGRGKVKWYDAGKGYGFISVAGVGDLFVHRTGLAEGVHHLEDDQEVTFEVEETIKGPQAVNVRPVAPTR